MKKLLAILTCLVSISCFAESSKHSATQTAGDIGQFALPLVALSLTVYDKNYALTQQFAKSLGTSLVIAYSLKYAVNEKRPNGGDHSFPSGHTTAAFAGASFIQESYGWGYGIPAYIAASFVGWTRVETKAHWTHDVVAGAALAVSVNYYFFHRQKKSKPTTHFQLQPTLSGDGKLALSASYRW